MRLITPGSVSLLPLGSTPKARATAADVTVNQQIGHLVEHVGHHQRVELDALAGALALHRLEQLLLAVEQALADDLDLRDHERGAVAGLVALGVTSHEVLGAERPPRRRSP